MRQDKCGIYQILCSVSGKSYVGSSRRIYQRWFQHRQDLRKSKHHSPRLQLAWSKHGEDAFAFSVLEECSIDELFVREQFHLDMKKRDYNSMPKVRVITAEMRSKMLLAQRRRAEQRTHCPHGHEYTPENTYIGKGKPNDKRCAACARDRTRAVLAAETPEQRESRRDRTKAYYAANRPALREKQNSYSARTREQKRAYDVAYRPIKNARRRVAKAA